MNPNVDEAEIYRLIGGRLRQLRERRGWSQAEVAERINMLRTSVSNIEAGRQRPPIHVLYQLCVLLDAELKQVLPSNAEAIPNANLFIEGVSTPSIQGLSSQMALEQRPQTSQIIDSLISESKRGLKRSNAKVPSRQAPEIDESL